MTVTQPLDDFDLEIRIRRQEFVTRMPQTKALECAATEEGTGGGDPAGFTGNICTIEETNLTCPGIGFGGCGGEPPGHTELCETDANSCPDMTDTGQVWKQQGPDLFFIKTSNTGSGKVEVHSATGASNYQSGQHSTTYFDPAEAANGIFQMVGPDLFYIKGLNTGSGKVEVHSATAASSYQSGQHSTTYFDPAEGANGIFQMVGPDLFYIKVLNTGSGKVEVHSATAASDYQSGQHSATYFDPSQAANGVFQMVGHSLYFVKVKNTANGAVEMYFTHDYQSGGGGGPTYFNPADGGNGVFRVAELDLFFVKVQNTGSGVVEMHSASIDSNFKSGLHSTTYFATADKGNGRFQPGNG